LQTLQQPAHRRDDFADTALRKRCFGFAATTGAPFRWYYAIGTGRMTAMAPGTSSPESWIDEHGNALYRYALVQLRDQHRAEELVQETFLAALQGRDRYSGTASVRTWLIGILKHKIQDQFRRDARETSLDESEHEDSEGEDTAESDFTGAGRWSAMLLDWGDPEEAMANGQFWAVLQLCLDHLPKRLARLFLLREVQDATTKEICKDLAITPTNLWTMLYRARMGLRQCLERNWVDSARR
jgi:RNA polymerase sigma-70 factor (ECF subfamily)